MGQTYTIAMLGRMLKPFLPRSLYWRAALIVFVPVVTILLVVSLAFVQRHYEGVTRQMTGNFALVARHIVAELDREPNVGSAEARARALSETFELDLALRPAPPEAGVRTPLPWYDLTGRLAVRELEARLDPVAGPIAGLVVGDGRAAMWLETRFGPLRIGFPLSRISARNPHQLLVLAGVIGLAMGLISFIYLKNQMRPIRRLALAADAFGRGQSMPYRPAGATEVRAAGAAFNQMRERIERHLEQRTLLLSGVSHDLRTPLTRMRLALSMLEEDPEVEALVDDVTEMEMLIDRFLEFARADASEPEAATDMLGLVRDRVETARRGGGDIVFETPEGVSVLELPLRPQLMGRALDNLIGNALRYGTSVKVRLMRNERFVTVSVEDNGPGIDPGQYERATRPFVRLDPARGASLGAGAGLGLAIVADAIHSHGGRLELDRGTAPGYGGLLARLILPLRR